MNDDIPGSPYARFPVLETIDISEASDIRQAVDRMIESYAAQGHKGAFSYRILLPRDQKSTAKAKKVGLAFQGEFVFGLRKRSLVPRVREVRYVHDERHYGWLLADPELYERFERGII
jgi:hypothetical protein